MRLRWWPDGGRVCAELESNFVLTQGGVGGETIRFDEPELSVEPAGVISPLLEGNGRKGGELFAMAKKGSHIVSRNEPFLPGLSQVPVNIAATNSLCTNRFAGRGR